MKLTGIILLFLMMVTPSKAEHLWEYCAYTNDSALCSTDEIILQDNFLLLGLNNDLKHLISYVNYQETLTGLLEIKGLIADPDTTYSTLVLYVSVIVAFANEKDEILIASTNLLILESNDNKITDFDRVAFIRHINYLIEMVKALEPKGSLI